MHVRPRGIVTYTAVVLGIALMGAAGLKRATQVAILNANYMAKRLEKDYDVLYQGTGGRVAHEFILDCRAFEKRAGVKVEDIAKLKMPDLNAGSLEAAIKTVAGTARSMGLDVVG